MLRLIAFFFGGIVLANVVIVAFEAARSSISAKQISPGVEQKAHMGGEAKPLRVAEAKSEPQTAPQEARGQVDWVHSERFNAYAEPKPPVLPQWLRRP